MDGVEVDALLYTGYPRTASPALHRATTGLSRRNRNADMPAAAAVTRHGPAPGVAAARATRNARASTSATRLPTWSHDFTGLPRRNTREKNDMQMLKPPLPMADWEPRQPPSASRRAGG